MATSPINGREMVQQHPRTEQEAEEIILENLGRDPAKVREAAKQSYEAMLNLADRLENKQKNESNENVVTHEISAAPLNVKAHENETDNNSKVDNDIKVVQVNDSAKAEMVKSTSKVDSVVSPTGYMEIPEGLYTWSPEYWNGLPLMGVPDKAVVKADRPTFIIFIIVQPVYARNRRGNLVKLPEGAKVVVHTGIAWAPVVPLAMGTEGRPVIWAAPMTLDKGTNKTRIAQPGEPLFSYELADGGREYALAITYDPDPNDPSKPRLISLDTLRGVTGG